MMTLGILRNLMKMSLIGQIVCQAEAKLGP